MIYYGIPGKDHFKKKNKDCNNLLDKTNTSKSINRHDINLKKQKHKDDEIYLSKFNTDHYFYSDGPLK